MLQLQCGGHWRKVHSLWARAQHVTRWHSSAIAVELAKKQTWQNFGVQICACPTQIVPQWGLDCQAIQPTHFLAEHPH